MNKNELHLEPDCYYHVYNRAVGDDNLFYSEENYFYFLKKYREYTSSVVETFSYCLMPNHFHFLIKVKSEKEISEVIRQLNKPGKTDPAVSIYVSKQFSNLFNGYSQAINKQQVRNGTLFSRAFKRKKIDSMEYLKNVVVYIHSNPLNHGFSNNIREWKHSSYTSILSGEDSHLKRHEVISWFEDDTHFLKVHENYGSNSRIKIDMD